MHLKHQKKSRNASNQATLARKTSLSTGNARREEAFTRGVRGLTAPFRHVSSRSNYCNEHTAWHHCDCGWDVCETVWRTASGTLGADGLTGVSQCLALLSEEHLFKPVSREACQCSDDYGQSLLFIYIYIYIRKRRQRFPTIKRLIIICSADRNFITSNDGGVFCYKDRASRSGFFFTKQTRNKQRSNPYRIEQQRDIFLTPNNYQCGLC